MMEELNKLEKNIDNKLTPKNAINGETTEEELAICKRKLLKIEIKILNYYLNNKVADSFELCRFNGIVNYMKTKINKGKYDMPTRIRKLGDLLKRVCG